MFSINCEKALAIFDNLSEKKNYLYPDVLQALWKWLEHIEFMTGLVGEVEINIEGYGEIAFLIEELTWRLRNRHV